MGGRIILTEQESFSRCIQQVYWDLLDAHGFTRGRKNELTFTGAAILMMSTGTRLRMQDIANAFQVSPSTVTDYVDHLEKHGYVRRERGNEDRRDVFVAPTHKGREMVIEVRQKTDDYVYDRLMRMTPGERKLFLELLTKFAGEPERITLSILTESRLDKN